MTDSRPPDPINWYSIRVKGALDARWADWFEGLTMQIVNIEETVLTGPVTDQAALYGILAILRDLGLILLSVQSYEDPYQCPGRLGLKGGE